MRQREQGWYVIDVVIEGVSLLQNFRTQIQEIVSSKGTDGLIQTLRRRTRTRPHPPPEEPMPGKPLIGYCDPPRSSRARPSPSG